MTLEEFLANPSVRRAHVTFKGFTTLYVRQAPRWLEGATRECCLDIATVDADVPGQGSFKRLFAYIRERHPDRWIYIENVLTRRFAEGLRKMGFIEIRNEYNPCFYLPPASDPRFAPPEAKESVCAGPSTPQSPA